MPIAKGISKQVAIKRESQWGVLAGAASARYLRRVTAAFNLAKETYQSNEMRTDFQISDMRHGVRSAEGSLSGELSPGSYSDLLASALARAFTAGATYTGAGTLTTSVVAAGSVYAVTRSIGSWITDGFRIGDVFRITTATVLNADNLNKNLMIVSMPSATVVNVITLNGSAFTAGGPSAASPVVAVVGKKTWAPLTGHTSESYTVEEWFSNISQSEVYTGMKVDTFGFKIPSSGMATLDIGMKGKDLAQTGITQYFTSPTAQSNSGVTAGVNGAVIFNGVPVALITDANININRNLSNATVLGSNSIAETFDGKIAVDGSISVYFSDAVARDTFAQETEVSLVFALSTNNSATADFVSICLPRVKLNSFSKEDNETGIVASTNFQALLNSVSTAGGELTTITVQDSLA